MRNTRSGKEEEEEKPEPPRRRSRQRSRARRSVVFAPPVKMDEAWEPTIVPKTDAEKAAIREVRARARCSHIGACWISATHIASSWLYYARL